MNLLPQELKKENLKIYRSHLAGWALFFLLLLVLVSVILLVPSYLIFSSKRTNVEKTLALTRARGERVSASVPHETVADVNKKISTLARKSEKVAPPSVLIDEIVAKRSQTLSITSLSITTGATISLEGVANTREDLVGFKEALEKSDYFTKVDSPISNLIADRDIKFSITAILK